jgi:hypothetical protein
MVPKQRRDDGHRWVLRARRQRPRCRRAAEHRDEVAALHLRSHSITSSARASKVGGTSMPSALAVAEFEIALMVQVVSPELASA